MKNTHKVSILIVTYNSWKYIKNTIKSCLNQTYENFDILILDNNSSDGTINYIKWLNNNKIKFFTSDKNLWPYKWLNFLLDKTDSEFIAIQDHDDIFHPNKIEESINFLSNNKKLIWCWNNVLVYYENENNWYIFKSQQDNHVMHTSLVFRNKWFRYRNEENYFLEDLYFQRKILCKSWWIWNIDKVLNLHLIKGGNNNLSSNWWDLTFNNFKKFFYVYWFWIYWIQIFGIFLIKKLFYSYFKKYEKRLIDKKYWLNTFGKLIKDKNLKILLDLYKNGKL